MAVRLRPACLSFLAVSAGFVMVPAFTSVANAAIAPADQPGTGPAEVAAEPPSDAIPPPPSESGADGADSATEGATDPAAGPGTESAEAPAVPEAGGDSPPVTDAPAGDATAAAPPVQVPTADAPPAEAAPSQPAIPAEPEVEPIIDTGLLDAEPADAAAPVRTRPTAPASRGISPEERSAALDEAYARLYRPADNPLRFNIAARAMFANMSNNDTSNRVNGRLGGAAIDIGPAWNRVAVAASLTGWGGRVQLPEDTGAEMNGMLGGGLSVGLGRLALLSRGYLDLRLGYDIYYGVVNRRSDAPSIVAPQSGGPDVIATPTENLLPHGPRLRLDMGLLGSNSGRFFHGLGLSIGYQALIGSLQGELPMTNMLTIGVSYWMG